MTTTSRRPGMTLIEVLISLMVVSLLSLSMAAMMQAVGYGSDARREVRRLAVRGQQLRLRMDDAVRTAAEILETDEKSYLVLWRGDENHEDANQDAINISELQLIDMQAGVVVSYTVPGPATDTVVARGSNYRQIMLNRNDKAAAPWATAISDLSIKLDAADPAEARLVTWRCTLTDHQLTEVLASSVARRPHGAMAQP